MAETVVINIEANTQGLQSTIDLLVKLGQVEKKVADDFKKTNEANVKSLQQGVNQTTGQYQKLQGAVNNLGKDNKLADALDATAPLVKTSNSLQQFKKNLKDAQAEVFLLREQFGDLDPRVLAAAEKVQQLRKEVGDTNKLINAVDPGAKFQAIQNLGGAIAGVFQVATGALQAFGVESEQATKIAQQFQGALNIFSGLQQLSQFKDALVGVRAALGLTATAQKGVAAANAASGASATGAAGAFRALTAAMLANPVTAIVAGLVAIGAALVAITDDSEETAAAIAGVTREAEGLSRVLTADIAGIDERTQKDLAAIEVKIAGRKAEGASIQEIAQLERERQLREGQAINAKIKANNTFIDEQQVQIERLQKLDDESSIEAIKNIQDKLDAAKSANKTLLSDALKLNTQIQVSDIENTEKVKEEAKRQREARKAASEQNFNRLIQANQELYAKERLEVQKTVTEEAELRTRLALLTLEEKEKQLEITKKYGKSTIAIEQEIFDIKKQLTADEIANRNKLIKEGLDQDLKNLDTYLNDAIDSLNNSYDERELAARSNANRENQANLEALQKGLINFEEYERRKTEIANSQPDLSGERALALAQKELDVLETRKQNLQDYGQSTVEIEKEISNKKAEVQNITTANEVAESEKRTAIAEEEATKKIDFQQKLADKVTEINNQIFEESKNLFFQGLSQAFESELEKINELKDEQLSALDEESEGIDKAYENRLIGKRQYEAEQIRITNQRVAAEIEAEKKITAIKKKQDIANRARALFEIAINTARAIMAVTAEAALAAPALIPQYVILGALQAAAVLAQPLPKYKKGTLSVRGVGTEDSELALLQPGEAVIPTETNRKYHPAIKAIYENKIKPQDINQFVTMKLRGDISRDAKADSPVMAKMDISDLYALGRIMKKNDGVTVKNIGELAEVFSMINNPRR